MGFDCHHGQIVRASWKSQSTHLSGPGRRPGYPGKKKKSRFAVSSERLREDAVRVVSNDFYRGERRSFQNCLSKDRWTTDSSVREGIRTVHPRVFLMATMMQVDANRHWGHRLTCTACRHVHSRLEPSGSDGDVVCDWHLSRCICCAAVTLRCNHSRQARGRSPV